MLSYIIKFNLKYMQSTYEKIDDGMKIITTYQTEEIISKDSLLQRKIILIRQQDNILEEIKKVDDLLSRAEQFGLKTQAEISTETEKVIRVK